MRKFSFLTVAALLLGIPFVNVANAGIISFDLRGTAGFGLLPGNEPGAISGGTGGEIGPGITYDDVSNLLTISNIGWGSSQGFTDLAGLANNSHIHGPTLANFGFNGTANFTQTAGVLFSLTRSGNAVTGGTITTAPILLTAAQETELLNGRYYVNIHTAANGGGEMRGFLVSSVPEPSSIALLITGGLFGLIRRRTRRIVS